LEKDLQVCGGKKLITKEQQQLFIKDNLCLFCKKLCEDARYDTSYLVKECYSCNVQYVIYRTLNGDKLRLLNISSAPNPKY